MSAENDHVIVTANEEPAGVGVCVHHHDFPEIRADGGDPKEAAIHLANHLTKALDSALTKWRREAIEKAIAEVNAFAG